MAPNTSNDPGKLLFMKTSKRFFIPFLVLLVSFPAIVRGQTYMTKSGHAQFFSKATLENFVGQSDYLVGKIDLQDSTVDFYLDLSTLHTGVRLRDEHMQEEYLETDKYPFAQFYGKFTTPFNPSSTDTQNVTVDGKFSIHNVSHEIKINGKILISPKDLYVEASWPIKLRDYNIAIPEMLFMKLSPVQAVSMKADLKAVKK